MGSVTGYPIGVACGPGWLSGWSGVVLACSIMRATPLILLALLGLPSCSPDSGDSDPAPETDDTQPPVDDTQPPVDDTAGPPWTFPAQRGPGVIEPLDYEPPAGNLLDNPGFEDGDDAVDGWAIEGEGEQSWAWATEPVSGGARSVVLDAGEGGWMALTQTVRVREGVVYHQGAHVAFDRGSTSPSYIAVDFLDDSDAVVSTAQFPSHTGTRAMALHYPTRLKLRAPSGATAATMRLYAAGEGQVWFDDLVFEAAPVGDLGGTITSEGAPLEGAELRLLFEPWEATYSTVTDADGRFALEDVPVALPRYILQASKDGLRTRTAGGLAIVEGQQTTVDLDLPPGADPVDTLRLGHASMAVFQRIPRDTILDDAVIPDDLEDYPELVEVHLQPAELIPSDSEAVVAVAEAILAELPEEDRQDTREVAWAVYEWLVTEVEHESLFSSQGQVRDTPWVDVTSAVWGTVAEGGWCWGKNHYSCALPPEQLLDYRSGMCQGQVWLAASIFRALGIPARATGGDLELWAQTPDGDAAWVEINFATARNDWRSNGSLGSGFAMDRMPVFAVDSPDPVLEGDWDAELGGLYREKHARLYWYEYSAEGLAEAEADLAHFEEAGERPEPNSDSGALRSYVVLYQGLELDLGDMLEQRIIDVRFPDIGASTCMAPVGSWAGYSSCTDCVVDSWVEPRSSSMVSVTWRHTELDISPLLD